jgi:outer membrane protein assembly factor BamB
VRRPDRWQAGWLVLVALAQSFMGLAEAGSAQVVLPCACQTSAGIFDSAGRLIRTLWSGKAYPAGPVAIDWDGRDDDGSPAAGAQRYRVRVLAHNVRYVWEGVIGNTSAQFAGPHVYRAANPINGMAIDARGDAFYVVGYNEQQSALHRFSTLDPQSPTALAHDDYRRVFKYAATDGTLAYFANVGLAAPRSSPMRDAATFVIALKVSDGSEYPFAQGRAVFPDPSSPGSNLWSSAVDYRDENLDLDGEFRDAPSGLAVQQRGNSLFVAHQYLNTICVLDKRDGRLLGNLAVERPSALAVAPDDSMWVLSQVQGVPTLVRFGAEAGQWVERQRSSPGLQKPVAIGVSPVDGTVVVADAGTEQLKAFADSGEPRWTFGRPGGYRGGDPQVSDDRLWLSADVTYISFQADGSLWFGDPGNARNLHLSSQRQLLGQIMYMPKSYHAAVDTLNPGRVFNKFLEFSVDYSRPLKDSWRLVRNWKAGLDHSYSTELEGLREVVTLSNGHTYGLVPRSGETLTELVELTPRGLRPTGARLEFGVKLYPDGSQRISQQRLSSFTVYTRKLSGFDSDNNPHWGAPEPLASVASVAPQDPYYHDVPQGAGVNEPTFPQSDGGVVVFFNPGKSAGFHLGGVRVGEDRWAWRASPSGHWTLDANGAITSLDGTYELGRGVQYPGNIVTVAGRQIIYGYHGEAWNGGQADQWMHYRDDGLFIGQFGAPVYAAQNRIVAHVGAAGNAFSPQLVSVNGRLYLWHNDEGVHGGVHRWNIEGVAQAKSLEAPIEP